MNPHTERLRRALHAAADAFADFLDAKGEVTEASAPVEASTETPVVVPNNDVAERFAREQLARRGWPQPARSKRRAS